MQNRIYLKNAVFYGFLAGFACFLLLIFMYKIININPLGGKKEIGIVFFVIALILAVANSRKANGGGIEFGKAYGISFFTMVIASLTSMFFLYLFLTWVAPSCLPEYIYVTAKQMATNKAQIIKNGISEEQFDDTFKNIKFTSIKSILIDDVIRKFFLGIIPTLMISLYFRRRFIN